MRGLRWSMAAEPAKLSLKIASNPTDTGVSSYLIKSNILLFRPTTRVRNS